MYSATSPSPIEATTEFCVIHIEDEPREVTSEPMESPVRTMVKPMVSTEAAEQSKVQSSIVLPGSPDLDHSSVLPVDEGSDNMNSDPQASWCGSSISSEVSVKSTDALIISGKN